VIPRGRASLHIFEEKKSGTSDHSPWWDVSDYIP
jgi:hypothetical protein